MRVRAVRIPISQESASPLIGINPTQDVPVLVEAVSGTAVRYLLCLTVLNP